MCSSSLKGIAISSSAFLLLCTTATSPTSNMTSISVWCFPSTCVLAIFWSISLWALRWIVEFPQPEHINISNQLLQDDLLKNKTLKFICFSTYCETAKKPWLFETLERQTQADNYSDWQNFWFDMPNLQDRPPIHASTTHHFDDDWSAGEPQWLPTLRLQDSKI